MNPGTPKKGVMYRIGQALGVLLILTLMLGGLVVVKLLWGLLWT